MCVKPALASDMIFDERTHEWSAEERFAAGTFGISIGYNIVCVIRHPNVDFMRACSTPLRWSIEW